jgi:hypothetical protein
VARHEDAVRVGVHRGVGTFDSLDALSTMRPSHLARKETESSDERNAGELARPVGE